MKLSMWNLADQLRIFHPRSIAIKSGQRILRNARLLADAREFSRTTAYVDRDASGYVMCTNDNDIILLDTDDIDTVLNTLLDAFDHYNEWDAKLMDTIQSGGSLHDLLELGAHETGRFHVLADATFYIRETGGDPAIVTANANSAAALEARSMPLPVIMRINAMEGVRSRNRKSYVIDIPELGTASTISNLFVDDEHEGWLITFSFDGFNTQAQLDLQDAFAKKLEWALRVQQNDDGGMSRASVFTDIISGILDDEATAYRRLATLGWKRDDAKAVYAICQVEQHMNPQHVVERFLDNLDISSVCVSYEGDLLFFVNASQATLDVLEERMRATLTMCGCAAGRSTLFKNIMEMGSQRDAAKVAAQAAVRSGQIVTYQEVKLPYSLSLLREKAAADVSHDALATLREYDAAHDTDMFETLASYLVHGSNATATARTLFIHRSTLLYRLERIEELTGVSLDDPDERFLLELSFRLAAGEPSR